MKLFVKIFITLVTILNIQSVCHANPIPVFLLFGWIDTKISTIYEYDGKSTVFNKCVKSYEISGSAIYEYDGKSTVFNKCVKSYIF